MNYKRIPYSERGTEFETVGTSRFPIIVPKLDYPISPRENFRRLIEHEKPMWVPIGITDFNFCQCGDLTGFSDLRFTFTERCDWVDLFGCVWEWIPHEGGSMLKPGQLPVCEDITEWERSVKWPKIDEAVIKANCEAFMARPTYHPDKMNYFDFGQGGTERLVAILGGYVEGMISMASEPEACHDFMMELSRFNCRLFDAITKYYPTDLIMYHDDWGTERESFFGNKMMDEIVYEPTELFLKHVKETSDVKVNFHSCGHIERFMPDFISLGADMLQLQPRANDMDMYKELYGDKICFDLVTRAVDNETSVTAAHEIVDRFGANGGLFSTIFNGDEEILWNAIEELYCYSREYYEDA